MEQYKLAQTSELYRLLLVCVLGVFLLFPTLTAEAGETVISNNVSVTSSSGGNSAQSGSVVEGEATSHIVVETIINDEVVEDIDTTITSPETYTETTVYEEENVVIETHISTAPKEVLISESTLPKEEPEENLSQATSSEETSDEEVNEKLTTEDRQLLSRIISQLMAYVFTIFTT